MGDLILLVSCGCRILLSESLARLRLFDGQLLSSSPSESRSFRCDVDNLRVVLNCARDGDDGCVVSARRIFLEVKHLSPASWRDICFSTISCAFDRSQRPSVSHLLIMGSDVMIDRWNSEREMRCWFVCGDEG